MSDEQTYPQVVTEAAECLIEEAQDEYDDGTTGEALREWFSERVWETCDGHKWVIYTHHAKRIVCESDNADAYGLNYGTEGMIGEGDIAWSRLAYAALEADIYEELDRQGFDVNDPSAYFEALAEEAEATAS